MLPGAALLTLLLLWFPVTPVVLVLGGLRRATPPISQDSAGIDHDAF